MVGLGGWEGLGEEEVLLCPGEGLKVVEELYFIDHNSEIGVCIIPKVDASCCLADLIFHLWSHSYLCVR